MQKGSIGVDRVAAPSACWEFFDSNYIILAQYAIDEDLNQTTSINKTKFNDLSVKYYFLLDYSTIYFVTTGPTSFLKDTLPRYS